MQIHLNQIEGCDKVSHLYSGMFNMLQEIMQDEDKLKDLTPPDFTALGMYIGKFVEQEINSSVVQVLRYYCGIDMPDYYCRWDKTVPYWIGQLKSDKKTVRLNEHNKNFPKDPDALKPIPLGEALWALKFLQEDDDRGFFDDYPWLSDEKFLEAWRNISTFRNRVAHAGEIIDADILKEGYMYFSRFMEYMPQMLEAKKEMAPNDYIDSLPKVEEQKPYWTETEHRERPYPPMFIAQRFHEILQHRPFDEDEMIELNGYLAKYSFSAMIFEEEDGKKGLKNYLRQVLVPAKYDGFDFLPHYDDYHPSCIAVRDDKYVLVALDGSGKELSPAYDEIHLADYGHPASPYIFRRDGLRAWGLMDWHGKIVYDCKVDQFWTLINGIIIESGGLLGYWAYCNGVFVPPIYDNIEPGEEMSFPMIFTLNGQQGYVKWEDASFMSMDELNQIEDEDERSDMMWQFINEADED